MSNKRIIIASMVGKTIEFYDFYIYATAAVSVFPLLFFPKIDAWAALLASMATFGVAFVARPFGAALFGHFGDRIGRKALITGGWVFYALIYMGFAYETSRSACVALFLAYGFYYGLTEPAERALVSDLAPAHLRGTAFGLYNMVIGLGALPASLLFGAIWKLWGAPCAFLTGAVLAVVASGLLISVPRKT